MAEDGKYTTDYGGLVERVDGVLRFTEVPPNNVDDIKIGGEPPKDWRLHPLNKETFTADERSLPENGPYTDEDITFIDD